MSVTKAAIAAGSSRTAAAGARIAREGGNAVDIAVAAALTAAVSEPLMSSLGGSAFFMIRPAGKRAELIEGADAIPTIHKRPAVKSPAWRTAHLPYGDGIDVKAGHASVAVPGMLAAAELAWKRHGRLPWHEIVAPAVEQARTEMSTDASLAEWLALIGQPLFSHQDACRQCYLSPDGSPLKEGEKFHIPFLDQAFETIAEQGAQTLYKGDLAATFAQEIQENGGFVTRQDLANYRAAVREPLSFRSRGFQLALNPPPAVGGLAVGILIKILQSNWPESISASHRALLLARAQLHLLGIREDQFNDPDFDVRAANTLLEDPGIQVDLPALKSPNTTQLSVVTADGGMVAITMSMGYGAGVIIPSLGIACNNSLGEPELNRQGFLVGQPGARLVSNMAPTLAWDQHGECIALGSPGASRITTSIAQTWANFAFEGMSLEEAVRAPRLHIEPFHDEFRAQFEPGVDVSLLDNTFKIRPFETTDRYFGAIKLTARDRDGQLHAIADERRRGTVEIVEQ